MTLKLRDYILCRFLLSPSLNSRDQTLGKHHRTKQCNYKSDTLTNTTRPSGYSIE